MAAPDPGLRAKEKASLIVTRMDALSGILLGLRLANDADATGHAIFDTLRRNRGLIRSSVRLIRAIEEDLEALEALTSAPR
jgi:hypothetical protein